MIITKDKVIQFQYILSRDDGKVMETSTEDQPTVYLHGYGNILPILEKQLEGKTIGDKLQITVPPEQGYGRRRENSVQRVPIKHLLTKGKIKPGMDVKLNTEQGAKDVRVIKVGRFNIDVDTNHPLAGETLHFDLEVLNIRDAEIEELSHGHAHGPGGHHH